MSIMSDQEIESCVKLRRNSWHTKLYKRVYGEHSLQERDHQLDLDDEGRSYYKSVWVDRRINLCPYMRRITWAIVLFPFLIIWRHLPESWQYDHDVEAKAISFYVVLCAMAHIIINLKYDVWYAGLLGVFGGLAIGFGIWGLVLVIELLKSKLYYRGSKTLPSGSLLKAYFRSKHNKICPCIEFVGDEESV